MVAAILAALEVADPPAEPLNIASGEAVAVNFLWNLVLETCGKKRLAIDPTYMPAPPWDPKHARPQIARACKVLGWAPAVRLREGLARTVEHLPVAAQRRSERLVRAEGGADAEEEADAAQRRRADAPLRLGGDAGVRRPDHQFVGDDAAAARQRRFEPELVRQRAAADPARISTASPLPRRTSSVVTPPPIPPAAKSVAQARCRKPPPRRRKRCSRSSDADLVEAEDNETKLDDGLEFEWAPVPAVPGLGR